MKAISRPILALPPALLAVALLAVTACQTPHNPSPTANSAKTSGQAPAQPPSLPQQSTSSSPGPQIAVVGKTVTLTVSVKGTPPLRYQWRKHHVNLPGATNDTLVLSNVQLSDSGSYTAVVSNQAGMTVSSPMLLVVVASPP